MYFVIFLIIFLVLLIAISIVNLFLAFSLKLVTNSSIEEYKFIIPSILYLITSGISFVLIYLVTINIMGLNLSESVMAIVFGTMDITPKIRTIVLVDSVIIILSILIESLCLLTVNIDYKIAIGKVRMFFKDVIKKVKKIIGNISHKNNKTSKDTGSSNIKQEVKVAEDKESSNPAYITVLEENEISENKEQLKLNLLSAIICSFFIFSFLSFVFMALFTAGNLLSSKIL